MIGLVLIGLGTYQIRQSGLMPVNEAADRWYDVRKSSEVSVELPRDDAPHRDYVEWWYYNGHLQDGLGNRFSFHYTVFLVNALGTYTVAHASIVDHQAREHVDSERRTPGNPSSGTIDSFDFVLGGWSMAGGAGKDRLRFDVDGRGLDLRLVEATPPVMQGGSGLLDFGGVGESFYYSRPRMEVGGTLTIDGEQRDVRGVAWFDHQWGNFEVFELGWDWFALQLDDGRDIMLYRLFDPRDGRAVLTSGTLAEDGDVIVLGAADFQIDPQDHWWSPHTGRRYPMGWRVAIPQIGLELKVDPILKDSEVDARLTTYMVYWEGPVRISGSEGGVGYVELSGYGKSEADRGRHR